LHAMQALCQLSYSPEGLTYVTEAAATMTTGCGDVQADSASDQSTLGTSV
jgi:hypothetical protein